VIWCKCFYLFTRILKINCYWGSMPFPFAKICIHYYKSWIIILKFKNIAIYSLFVKTSSTDCFLEKYFRPHYNLYLQSISVNGQFLQIDPAVFATSNNRGTIVDSGTTLSYLAEEAYTTFVNAVSYVRQFLFVQLINNRWCFDSSYVISNSGIIFSF